jgi:hypothetical protein
MVSSAVPLIARVFTEVMISAETMRI